MIRNRMDFSDQFQVFENCLSDYSGDDPLELWIWFFEYLVNKESSTATDLSFVLERLVRNFLTADRYANDIRYVNLCIKYASYHTEPFSVYASVYSEGVGRRAAPLYVAWAKQFEQSGALEQARAVYRRAVENQAQPAETVLDEYSQFQMRTSKSQIAQPATGRLPLQTSQLVNQIPPHKEAAACREDPGDCADLLPPEKNVKIYLSRSDNLGVRASGEGPPTVSMYHKDSLALKGSELCFEEVRAARYFQKIRRDQEHREIEERDRLAQEKEDNVMKLQHSLDLLNQQLVDPVARRLASPQATPPTPAPSTATRPTSWSVFSDEGAAASTSTQPQHRPHPHHPAAPRVSLELSRRPPARLPEGGVRSYDEHRPAPHPALKQSQLDSGGPRVEARPGLPCVTPTSTRSFLYGSRQAEGGAPGRSPRDPQAAGGQRQHGVQEREFHVEQPADAEPRLDISQGATASFSHITPNTSLGLVSATPSRALPSPTVNTREALDAIMNMFQAPTLLEDPFPNTLLGNSANRSPEAVFMRKGASSLAEPAPSTAPPFTIYQDHGDQENPRAAAVCGAEKPRAARALAGIPGPSSDRPSDGTSELTPDESTMWGVRYNSLNSLAACPNSTRDFAPSAQGASTPFPAKAHFFVDSYQDQENGCQRALDDEGNVYTRPKKLSPIIETSPSDETFNDKAQKRGPAQHGTVMGEALSLGSHSGLANSCTTVVLPPPAALSFRDHTLLQSARSPPRAPGTTTTTTTPAPAAAWSIFTSPEPRESPEPSTGTTTTTATTTAAAWSIFTSPEPRESPEPSEWTATTTTTTTTTAAAWSIFTSPEPSPGTTTTTTTTTAAAAAAAAWSIFTSPEPPAKPTLALHHSQEPEAQDEGTRSQSTATIGSGSSPSQEPVLDVPMSPECGLKPDWLMLCSPEAITEPDLDAFISPPRTPGPALARRGDNDVSMSPEAPTGLFTDACMSPVVRRLAPSQAEDEPMSPDRGGYGCTDVPMSPEGPAPAAGGHRVTDPWDSELIAELLSRLSPPLGSHPHCISWQCNVPSFTPRTTITMGNASLSVDCLLGEGAFAKVYQATDPMTSEKIVLKVQKPGNAWEFYMNTQLDARLPPAVRHLYSNVQSAHLFHNGSILLAELHRCGTLLNAVNQYKKLSDKVMPQPLVMYFTTCLLHMVEQLHRVHLVHADIKPDNFLLGERFLESQCLDPEEMEHGMVLVDLGQSIDMELFPEGTQFTARCQTSGFQCTEMLSGRPWSYQTDYFGIAGTVYCMLFGTYMQVKQENGVWKTNAVFRRNPHSELWLELFHTLLNIPAGGALPCLRSLRCRLAVTLRETYGSKVLSLKNRLLVLLLEDMRAARR
ncbi:unnamed protein product [Arctogadus glacialis]